MECGAPHADFELYGTVVRSVPWYDPRSNPAELRLVFAWLREEFEKQKAYLLLHPAEKKVPIPHTDF
jgi:hypothetical protein